MKRKISIVLAIAMLLSTLSISSIANAASITFNDVNNSTKYSSAIITLTKLGIINGYQNEDQSYSFKPDGEITRAEFTKIITVALGVADAATNGNSIFTDISEHWAKNNIVIAADRGIVNGFEDATFRPDEKVTYEQAVKMIVCSAGYETGAQALGGWPNGYISQATSLGITKGVSGVTQSGPATRGVVAQLMYNVLDVEIPSYNVQTGRLESDLDTFMEKYLGVVSEKCTIVGVEDKTTSEYTEELLDGEMAIKLKDNTYIVMDYTTFSADKSVLEALVGKQAVVYYKEGKNGNPNTLFEIDTDTTKNTTLTIKSRDIESFNKTSISYYDANGKSKTQQFKNDSFTVYYNGKEVPDYNVYLSDWLTPGRDAFIYGDVTLTDSGSDGTIDIIEIMDYEVLIAAKTPSTTDYIVTNKMKFVNPSNKPFGYLSEIKLDPESVNYDLSITKATGEKIEPTAISANDVLLVAMSLQEDNIIVKVGGTPVSGKIMSINNDEGKFKIGENEYYVNDYAFAYFDDAEMKVETSTQGTFYTDAFGEIVYGTLSTTENNYPYAYIIKAVLSDERDSATVQAYVPAANGIMTYTIGKKVKITENSKDASKTFDAESAVELLRKAGETDSYLVDEGKASTKVVRSNACQIARLCVEGTQIQEIILDNDPTLSYGTKTEDSTALVTYDDMPKKIRYQGANNFGDFMMNSSTTIMYIPSDRTKTSLYGKRSVSSFSSDTSYWVQPFNVNGSKVANLVLLFGSEQSVAKPTNGSFADIIASESTTKIKDEEEVYSINYYDASTTIQNRTAEKENITATEEEVTYQLIDMGDLGVGDIFRAGVDSVSGFVNGEIVIDYDDVLDELSTRNYDFTDDNKFHWYSSYYSYVQGDRSKAKRNYGNYGEAYVVNVIEVLDDNGHYTLRVTRDGFDDDGNLPEDNEFSVEIVDSTIIYRISDDGKKVTPYIEGSDSERVTALDLQDFKYDGERCSKIAVFMYGSTDTNKQCKFIIIYE